MSFAVQIEPAQGGVPDVDYRWDTDTDILTVAHNRLVCPGHDRDGTEEALHARVELDIEGNQLALRDAGFLTNAVAPDVLRLAPPLVAVDGADERVLADYTFNHYASA